MEAAQCHIPLVVFNLIPKVPPMRCDADEIAVQHCVNEEGGEEEDEEDESRRLLIKMGH